MGVDWIKFRFRKGIQKNWFTNGGPRMELVEADTIESLMRSSGRVKDGEGGGKETT